MRPFDRIATGAMRRPKSQERSFSGEGFGPASLLQVGFGHAIDVSMPSAFGFERLNEKPRFPRGLLLPEQF